MNTMALDVDSVLRRIKQFGPYQIRILVMFFFIFFPIAYQTLIMVFAAYEPPWMCANNSTACLESNSSSAQNKIYSTATRPIELYERRCSLNRSDWKFADYNLYEGPHHTIVDEFDLVCSRSFLAWLANAILFFGWAVGAIVLGPLADKYGRKSVFFPSLLVVLLGAFAMAFAKVFWVVAFCRFIVGFFQAGCLLSLFVLATELVGPEKRALAGSIGWYSFTAALMVLGLKAYYVHNWRTLTIISSAPWIFTLAFWKFIPESVRWLLVNGRKEEARQILTNVARVNKRDMPSDELQVPATTTNKGLVNLFRTWKLAKLSIIQLYAWFVHGVLYLGLSLSAGEFGGSIYLNFVLTSLVEFPSHVLAIDCCNRFGRKKTTVFIMIIAGLCTVGVSFIPAGTENTAYIAGRVTLGMLGKLFITASFDALYVFSSELFPTVVRNGGMGMASVANCIGGTCSPFVVQMTRVNAILPFAFMGGLSFVAAFFCWFLPETLGKKTPEVMEDAGVKQEEEFGPHAGRENNLIFSATSPGGKKETMDLMKHETKQETNVYFSGEN